MLTRFAMDYSCGQLDTHAVFLVTQAEAVPFFAMHFTLGPEHILKGFYHHRELAR